MGIDYLKLSDEYRPSNIRTLLIGESSPPAGKQYFYLPRAMKNIQPLRKDTSLPATIFGHYFGRRPETEEEYRSFLIHLCENGIFLIDIYDRPLRVRNNPEGLKLIKESIPLLRKKMAERHIAARDEQMIFLLARQNYKRQIKQEFPRAQLIPWIDFRLNTDLL